MTKMHLDSKKERIYIAGPFSPFNSGGKKVKCNVYDGVRELSKNIDTAIKNGISVIDKGHYVYVPHLDHYIQTNHSSHTNYGVWWYENDMTYIDHWATAILMGEGWKHSNGSIKEHERAKELGLKIYYNVEDIPNAISK